MGNIILVSIEVLILGVLLINIPFFSLVIITVLFLIELYFWLKIKKIIYYAIPILFLIHSFFSVSFIKFYPKDIIKCKVNLVEQQGKIDTIFNKYPVKNIFLKTENIEDGKYEIKGEILDISKNNRYYNIEILNSKKINPNFIEKFFNKKFNYFKNYLKPETSNFLKGTILGEKRYIYPSVRKNFIYSGAAHLLAISGLHIGIILGIITYILTFFKFRRNIYYSLSLVFLSLYVLGINKSPSLIRAYIMAGSYLIGKIFYEKNDLKKSFSLAIIINLLIFPTSCNNISFILSYVALFSIIYIFPMYKIQNKKNKYKNLLDFLIFTGILQIFIFPINIYFFKTFPLLSYFTNIVVTTIGSIFTMIGGISFFLPKIIFRFFTSHLLDKIYLILKKILILCSHIPYLNIKFQNNISLKFIVFIYIILIIVAYRKTIVQIIKRRKNYVK